MQRGEQTPPRQEGPASKRTNSVLSLIRIIIRNVTNCPSPELQSEKSAPVCLHTWGHGPA